MKQDGVRRKLKTILNKQAKQLKSKCRDKCITVEDLFNLLNSENQKDFFYLLSEKELDEFLSCYSKQKFFENISEDILESVVYNNSDISLKILRTMPDDMLEKFVNDMEAGTFWGLFEDLFFDERVKVLKMLTMKKFSDFLENDFSDNFVEFLEDFEEDKLKSNSVAKKEIYSKVLQLEPQEIAIILEGLGDFDTNIVVKILQEFDEQKIFDICSAFQNDKLYELLVKCDFSIILNGNVAQSTLICQKISNENRKELLETLIEKNIDFNQIFDVEGIKCLYMAASPESKKYILEHILVKQNIKDFRVIYESCSEHEKINLLEMMVGNSKMSDKITEIQSDLRSKATELLKQKADKREFFEELVLNYLSTGKEIK